LSRPEGTHAEIVGDIAIPENARRLLVAAVEIFGEVGFHAATTRKIAARVNLSPAAVYVHYRSKEDLLYAISSAGHKSVLSAIDAATAVADRAGESPDRKLWRIVRALAWWHARYHVLARVVQHELLGLKPVHYRAIATIRRKVRKRIQDVIQEGFEDGRFELSDVGGSTLAIVSLSVDLARWFPSESHSDPEKIAEFYADLALRMVSSSTQISGDLSRLIGSDARRSSASSKGTQRPVLPRNQRVS
jgi:AcrR family transcriptional regulator